jgi:D-alanine-D-alanine ligase
MSQPQALIVFTGGYSGEAVISRKSAAMVMAQIDRIRFQPVLVHINPKGWFMEDELTGEKTTTNLECTGQRQTPNSSARSSWCTAHPARMESCKPRSMKSECVTPREMPDCMALTFNKGQTNALLREKKIEVARSVELAHLSLGMRMKSPNAVGIPCFVKPNETGSSIGISRAETVAELAGRNCI